MDEFDLPLTVLSLLGASLILLLVFGGIGSYLAEGEKEAFCLESGYDKYKDGQGELFDFCIKERGNDSVAHALECSWGGMENMFVGLPVLDECILITELVTVKEAAE